jgi:hypothetical protein
MLFTEIVTIILNKYINTLRKKNPEFMNTKVGDNFAYNNLWTWKG